MLTITVSDDSSSSVIALCINLSYAIESYDPFQEEHEAPEFNDDQDIFPPGA